MPEDIQEDHSDQSFTKMQMRTSDSVVQMDPRLQRIVAYRQYGSVTEATASSQPDEVAVVAKVTSRSAWEGLSEVRASSVIGNYNKEDRTTIVTGRIPASRIESVRTQEFVKSLKAAQSMKPELAAGVSETSARPDQLPKGSLSNGGSNVVVGIIDYGCDFNHRNFISATGKTRLMSIWHQGGIQNSSGAVPYGREYTRNEIDSALTQPSPYNALGYGPRPDTPFSIGSHGTHVMDIAAGNGLGSGAAGFAPNADLIFVDVSHADLPFAEPGVVDSSFGDSVMLLEAIEYIYAKAGNRPCVINISLGTNGGPHDGTTLVEEGIDRLVSAAPNRAVTISASNSFDDGIHASGVVPAGGSEDIVWRVPFNDTSPNELELWYPASDRFTLELIDPAGTSLGTIAPGSRGEALDADGNVLIFVASRLTDPNNGDNVIGIYLERTVPSGNWTVRLHGSTIVSGQFHAWLERDNINQSSFAPPHDNTFTIGSISCGHNSIVVGSYDAHKTQRPISWFSSAGPTRDGRHKPELSAPGHAVLAAHSRTMTGVVSKSGTSMASPAVAGGIALVFGEAQANGINLTIDQLRNIVIGNVNRNPPSGSVWNDRFGNGRMNVASAIRDVQAMAGGSPAAKVASTSKKRKRKRRTKTTKKA